MQRRHYAQRQHLVHAFDNFLYQLHTLSFFLSPSIWGYVFRIISQFQCAKPKDIDLTHSLRFYCAVIFTLNIPSFYMHLAYGVPDGRAVVLDFVGMAYTPSRLQLFSLDLTILFLQLLTIVISYSTAVAADAPGGEDILLPNSPSTPLPSGLPSPLASRSTSPSSSSRSRPSFFNNTSTTRSPNKLTSMNGPEHILDLRIQPLMGHLRNPPPPPTSRRDPDSGLPLPNTTAVRLPSSLRMLVRTQAALARRTTTEAIAGGPVPQRRATEPSGRREGRVPGAMDTD